MFLLPILGYFCCSPIDFEAFFYLFIVILNYEWKRPKIGEVADQCFSLNIFFSLLNFFVSTSSFSIERFKSYLVLYEWGFILLT